MSVYRNTEWTLIGEIGVDSGQVCVADPCYDWDYDKDVLPVALKAIETHKSTYEINDGTLVVAQTLYGDGTYPVFAKLDRNGNVLALMVDFDPEEDESWDDDEDEDW